MENKLCKNSAYTWGNELPIKYKQMFVHLGENLFMEGFVINCTNAVLSSKNQIIAN